MKGTFELKIYRALFISRMEEIKKTLDYEHGNLKYLDDHSDKFENVDILRGLFNASIEGLTEYYNKMQTQLDIIDKEIEYEEKENES